MTDRPIDYAEPKEDEREHTWMKEGGGSMKMRFPFFDNKHKLCQ